MEEKSFEEWFDALVEFIRGLGYNGPIDRDTFTADYEACAEPMEVAKEFVEEINN